MAVNRPPTTTHRSAHLSRNRVAGALDGLDNFARLHLFRGILNPQARFEKISLGSGHALDLADGLLQQLGAVRTVKTLDREVLPGDFRLRGFRFSFLLIFHLL